MSRIILCGASSVGKTTLASDWCYKNKNKKPYVQITEVARDVMREHNISRHDMVVSLSSPGKDLYFELQGMIIEEQNKREFELQNQLFISDRGPDPFVYCYLENQEKAMNMSGSKALMDCFARYRESLVVIVCPLDNQTDDGYNYVLRREDQYKFTDGLHEVLRHFSIPYMYLDEKDRMQRVEKLKKAVEGEIPIPISQFMEQDKFCLSFYLDRESAKKQTHPLPYLPLPKEGKEARVRTFDLNPSEIILTCDPMDRFETNRMVERYGEDNFVLIQFHQKLPTSLIRDVLQKGVQVNGAMYQFLGCSSSGLKSRKCYLLKGDVKDVEEVLFQCGDFSKIKMVSKRLKRISMLFSVAKDSDVEVPDEKVLLIDDIETSGGNFTDGCGFVGLELAKQIALGANAHVESPQDRIPCVYQIRFQGCKGIVIKDPEVGTDTIHVRKSMRKFDSGARPFPNVWVCDHSRPYSYGHLNKQYIMLLSGLGIKDEVFLKKQDDFLTALENMLINPEFAVAMLNWRNHPDIALKINSAVDLQQEEVQHCLRKLRYKFIEKMEKLSIPILDSRTLFGVCDPRGVMEYGECFIRITVNGVPQTLEPNTSVTVGKNPCYLLGDIRVLRAVDRPELNHLVDCIVFPVKGKAPHSAEIAGSDMDGDQYLVCWDQELVPPSMAEPYDYPSIEAFPSDKVTRDMMIDYFSRQKNMMGRINNCFQYWADLKNPGCFECEQLGAWFSRSVDSSKTGDVVRIPRNLVPPRNPNLENIPKKVWKVMEGIAKERQKKLAEDATDDAQDNNQTACAISEEFIKTLLDKKDRSIGEYKLFKLVYKWCQVQNMAEVDKLDKLCELSDHINFGLFTNLERKEAIQLGIPAEKVMNALNKSKLLNREMLRPFYLNTPACGWKFFFRASSSEFQWPNLYRAILDYPESMLVLQLPMEIKLAFHFIGPFEHGESIVPAGSLVSYFFSPLFGSKLRYVTETEYNLNLTERVIQFYRDNDEINTFLWLKSLIFDKEDPDLEHYDRVSIDLTRFERTIIRIKRHPLIQKMHFYSAEVFVKCERIEEIAYLDIHESDQPVNLTTTDLAASEDLEELPSDEEDMQDDDIPSTDPIIMRAPDPGLKDIAELARKGEYIQFCNILSDANSDVLELIQSSKLSDQVLSLLSSIIVKHSHKNPKAISDYLRKILESPHIVFKSPKDFLTLYSSLSKLHLNDLIQQHIMRSLDSLVLDNIAQYYQCIFDWELWCFVPFSASLELLHKLYVLQLDLEPKKLLERVDSSDSISLTIPDTIQDLAQSVDKQPPPIEESELNKYKCHFAHLMLLHLLAEAPGPEEYNKVADSENSVCMLRVNNSENDSGKETLVNVVELEDSSDEDEEVKNQEPKQDSKQTGGVKKEKKKRKKKKKTGVIKICFSKINKVTCRSFTVGSFVKIRLLPKPSSTHSNEPIAFGSLSRVSTSPAAITVDIREPVPKCILRSAELQVGFWCLTLIGNVTSFKRSTKSLRCLINSEITPILISQEAFPPTVHKEQFKIELNTDASDAPPEKEAKDRGPTHNPYPLMDNCNACKSRPRFNPSQEDAIYSALHQRITLIHGPPGTGKTHVASEIVHQMYHSIQRNGDGDVKTKILVAAETHNAVDNLTRKLLGMNMLIVRVGKLSQISKDIHEHTLDQQVEMKRVELGKDKRGEFQSPKLKKEILHSADIIAATCTGAGDADLKEIKFSFILIDEATQALEPVSLISIVKSCQQLVLIGDPNQLAPILPSKPELQNYYSKESPSFETLRVTLFHRLHKTMDSLFLDEQHRMHPYIASFPSRVFYQGRLKNGVTKNERRAPSLNFLYPHKPVVFIDVESDECRIGSSIKNPREADVIVHVVKKLLATTEFSWKDIGILTPYTGQVRCIKDKLEFVAKVEVCSIDGFQGKEKEVIVFSTVRSNANGVLGFTDDQYRINVLLTRAKRILIGVGNYETLSYSEIWKDWFGNYDILSEDKFYELSEIKDDSRDAPPYRDRSRNDGARSNRNNNNYYPFERQRGSVQVVNSRRKPLTDFITFPKRQPPRGRIYERDSNHNAEIQKTPSGDTEKPVS